MSYDYVQHAASVADLRLSFHLVQHDGIDVAGAALTWRRRGPYRDVVVPPFTPYSALILSSAPPPEAVHEGSSDLDVLLDSIERRYHLARLHLHGSLQDVRAAAWHKWQVHPLYTYVFDFKEGVADVSPAWSESAARNFRSHRDEYELLEDGSAAVASVDICARSYGRRRRQMPLREEQLLPLIQHMRQSGLATSFAVRNLSTDEIEAALTILFDSSEAFYWVTGSQPGPSMSVLLGLVLPILSSRGIRRFDFMGANTPSVAEFKRRLGCRLETYYGMTFVRRPELKLLSTLRHLVR